MKRLFGRTGRILIIISLSIALVVSIGLSFLVNINYDLRKYLPEDSNTMISMDILIEEFGETSMAQMMSTNLEIAEAASIVDEINKIEVVRSVIWLGVIADITMPVEQMDQEMIKDYYKDGNLLFLIEFKEDDYSLVVGDAINKIEKIMNDNNINTHFRGPALGNKSSRELVTSEMFMILVIAVPIAILILFLASNSWIEPVIILINLGVAIAINMGTNYIMPNISYITISIASILQLAMSLDYSLFIVHRYYETRDEGNEPVEAAARSAKDAFGTVTASALTTVFGFLALIIMSYKIGMDVGLNLAKAIIISYIVTLFLMPVLLIIFDKPLLKLRHKMLIPKFSAITKVLFKGRKVIAIFLMYIGFAAFLMQGKVNFLYGDSPLSETESKLYIDEQEINKQFGAFQPVVILYENQDKQDAIFLANQLLEIPEVMAIQSLVTSVDPTIPEDIIPAEALTQFKGNNKYYRMIIYLDQTQENERSYELSEIIINLVDETLTHCGYAVGVPLAVTEIKSTVTSDGFLVQLISAITIALVIGLILKNPILPLILVILIEIAIWINMSVTFLTGGVVAYIGFLVVSSLQLGATIDYAVLATGRYQEFREEYGPKEAMIRAMNASAPAIITSAAVLTVAGFVVVLISSIQIVEEIGMLVGRGALLSGFIVLFILPALLLLFDKPIQKTTLRRKKKRKKALIKEETNEKENN